MPKAHRKYPDYRVHPTVRPQQSCLLAGKIMWLPKQSELQRDLGIDDGCYNHPVVVLSPFPESEKVIVLLITSLKGRAIKDCRWTQDVRAGHLPVHPCDPHPDNGKVLRLKSNRELTKKSYVKTMKKLKIPLHCLRDYHGRHGLYCIFTAASYKELLESAQFQPPIGSPSHTRTNHRASPELIWPNSSGPDTTGFPTLHYTNRPLFTPPGQSYQAQHAHRVNPLPVASTYADIAEMLPSQYARIELHPPRLSARSSPSAFQPNSYSNVELERQIRAVTAARTISYGTIIPSNTTMNTRPDTRRGRGHLPSPVQYERRAVNDMNEGCLFTTWFLILCIVVTIGFWTSSARSDG
ncbi:hypothetical protein EDB81DRAFT_950411 [Dactylonectria macrodidyma]|uniref:Uncharacterized protein n=1 Tax=Dactylonectria macrodidyma TaxID=307937 RepID=A0A9P9E5L3_9HYPO|nr:hypothetical protein EDB81DRAFT_950411 [Dactylonectria macrodidyma]